MRQDQNQRILEGDFFFNEEYTIGRLSNAFAVIEISKDNLRMIDGWIHSITYLLDKNYSYNSLPNVLLMCRLMPL